MKKLFVILSLTLMIATNVTGGNLTARQVLDKTAAVLTSKSGAQAEFVIKNTIMGTSKGEISVKNNKFMAKIPAGMVWYDGKTQWTYLRNNEEVNVTTPNAEQQQLINPYTFIYLYKKGYTYTMAENSDTYSVTLKGQDKSKGIGEMVIVINKKTFVPSLIRMRQGKTWTTITVKNFKRTKLNDSIFRFNSKDFPQAEIIDLR